MVTIPKHDLSTEAIEDRYRNLPDQSISLLCSYVTRMDGFLDILLSRKIISSGQAKKMLGAVKTHRGSMGHFSDKNDYISFSTGFVSFKYSDNEIRNRDEYVGGLGILVPLQVILQYPRISFSHTSTVGNIKNFDLNAGNIVESVHHARRSGELCDDGYGNLFEVSMEARYRKGDTSLFKTPIEYPILPIDEGVIVAIPESQKTYFEDLLKGRQSTYRSICKEIQDMDVEKLRFSDILGIDFSSNPQEIKDYLPTMLQPIDLESLPIYWYPEKNLEIAMKYVATVL